PFPVVPPAPPPPPPACALVEALLPWAPSPPLFFVPPTGTVEDVPLPPVPPVELLVLLVPSAPAPPQRATSALESNVVLKAALPSVVLVFPVVTWNVAVDVPGVHELL